MYLIYLDESYNERHFVYSALAVHSSKWKECFALTKQYRHKLRNDYGIYIYRELHASDFVKGRGKISGKIVTKYMRNCIFRETIKFVSSLDVLLFNLSLQKPMKKYAFERFLNRIQRTMVEMNDKCILFADEGNEKEMMKLFRKMCVYNLIPSRFDTWMGTTSKVKNITIDNILEDVIFKRSNSSYFLQLVDFCAYALLMYEGRDVLVDSYEICKTFVDLKGICYKLCNPDDDFGVIR